MRREMVVSKKDDDDYGWETSPLQTDIRCVVTGSMFTHDGG